MGKVISRIPLTGGPKGGKTTIKEAIKEMIEKEYGYKVFVVQETATEVINSGFIPSSMPKDGDLKKIIDYYKTNYAFQLMILILQLAKERAFEIAAEACPEDVVIIYDRAVMDNAGYLMKNLRDSEIFVRMLQEQGYTIDDIMARYDGVISLGTSASIIDFNKSDVNDITKRLEDGSKEAEEVDYYVSQAWMSHPNYIRIEATEDVEEKKELVLAAVRGIINKNKTRKLQK